VNEPGVKRWRQDTELYFANKLVATWMMDGLDDLGRHIGDARFESDAKGLLSLLYKVEQVVFELYKVCWESQLPRAARGKSRLTPPMQ
jgi:hypothetical protein